MTRLEKKIPYAAVACQRRSAASSPSHVVAIPVGPTGGERPQARASRGLHPSQVRRSKEMGSRRRSGRIGKILALTSGIEETPCHFGHVAGDDALRRVAQAIRKRLRAGDGLYRYGGEEFRPPPGATARGGDASMNRVRAAVEQLAIPTHGERGVLTISAGVAELDPSRRRTPEDWLCHADAELYGAKSAGRNHRETNAIMLGNPREGRHGRMARPGASA